jgi:hypothetical protein
MSSNTDTDTQTQADTDRHRQTQTDTGRHRHRTDTQLKEEGGKNNKTICYDSKDTKGPLGEWMRRKKGDRNGISKNARSQSKVLVGLYCSKLFGLFFCFYCYFFIPCSRVATRKLS